MTVNNPCLMILKKITFILFLFDFVLASTKKRLKTTHKNKNTISNSSETTAAIESSGYIDIPNITSKSNTSLEPFRSVDDIVFDEFLTDLENSTSIVNQETTIAIPDNLEFPEDFFVSTSYTWDVEAESEWTLTSGEYRQYIATLVYDSAARILNISNLDLFDGRFAFDRIWPGTTQSYVPNQLFFGFQSFALKLLFTKRQNMQLEILCKAQLIDLTRPIYEHAKNLYHSFISIAVSDQSIPVENAAVVIKYSSKFMANWPNSDGFLPLDFAIKRNRLDIVRKLVYIGADINKSQLKNWPTPFMIAVKLKNQVIVIYFLDSGKVDPNVILPDGTNVIVLFACYLPENFTYFFKKISEKLSEETFNLILNNLYDTNNSIYNILIAAVLKGNHQKFFQSIFFLTRKVVEMDDIFLLNSLQINGIPLKDLVFEAGFKLIHFAAANGNIRITRFLLGKGAFIDSVTDMLYTPMQLAYTNKHTLLVRELIALGAAFGLCDILQIAVINNEVEIFETLISYSNSLNHIIFTNGYKLITWCIAQDRPKILQLLVNSKKVDVNVADQNGKTIFNFKLPESASLELTSTVSQIIQQSIQNNNNKKK